MSETKTTTTSAAPTATAKAAAVDPNKDWKDKVKAAAKVSGEWYGVPAQVLAAIATLESGWGKHLSAPHNYCGMKWSPRSLEKAHTPVGTKEVVNGREVEIKASFIAFRSLEHCLDHLAKKLRYQEAYAASQRVLDKQGSIDQYVEALAKVYATDPNYAKKIKDVMVSLEK